MDLAERDSEPESPQKTPYVPPEDPSRLSRDAPVPKPISLSKLPRARELYQEYLSKTREAQGTSKAQAMSAMHVLSAVSSDKVLSPGEDTIKTFYERKGKQRTRNLLSPEWKAKHSLVRHLGSCSTCRSRRVPCRLEHHDLQALENSPFSNHTKPHPTQSDPTFPAKEVAQYSILSSYNKQLSSTMPECSVNPDPGDSETIWNFSASHLSHDTAQLPAMQPPADQQFFLPQDQTKPNLEFLKQNFYEEGSLTEEQALYILDEGTQVLKQEPSLLSIDDNASIIVYGDVHGQYYDLMRLFEVSGDLKQIDRFLEPPAQGQMCDVVWADPLEEFGQKKRHCWDVWERNLYLDCVGSSDDRLLKGWNEEWGNLRFSCSHARIGKLLDRDYVWVVTQTMVSFENLALWAVHTVRTYKVYPGFWGRRLLSLKGRALKVSFRF